MRSEMERMEFLPALGFAILIASQFAAMIAAHGEHRGDPGGPDFDDGGRPDGSRLEPATSPR
jgi:hypothetical protein